jgi:hypothetical protein
VGEDDSGGLSVDVFADLQGGQAGEALRVHASAFGDGSQVGVI